ncbi:MAG: Binding-protein-dependent transport systems inner membrane component [Acetothermia bacterium 64_32]|nr:MAG: Binding-protein-dependent transport systems inner membrane component [Acetothermia bacterium 64_32]MBC7099152.1 sugar ABC transporter permease [Candidatus Bipolaricaulota bacterium]HAF70762.1 ABC transporter permease [Candidatus Acetothermia bacterium]
MSWQGKPTARLREELAAWRLLTPAVLLLLVFLVAPFVMSVVLSFTNQRLVSPLPTRFVGVRNYARLFGDADFWKALRNTILFAAVVVPVQSGLALFLATLVNKRLPGTNFFRGIYFMPVVIPMVVVCVVWYFLLMYPEGLLNTFVQIISLGRAGPYDWLRNPSLALPTIMLVSIWQGVGFQMIIYLAGLQNIPQELYEAARIDGASPWAQFLHVTMPGLRNTHIFVLVTTTILAFKLFTQVEVLTQGGPLGATNTLVRYIYSVGYRELKVGYASAASVIFVLIVLFISLIQRRLLREEREVS